MERINMSTPSRRRMPFISRASITLALAAGVFFGTGCNRDQVTRNAPPPAPVPTPGGMPGMGGAMPPMGAGEVPAPPAPSTPLKWTLPKGWTETAGTGMRFATLTPPGPGRIELSVVCLPGAAGGELANVNRWRGQIGLEPLDEKALDTARLVVKTRAGAVAVFDFTGPGQAPSRMITGTLSARDGSTWFLKLLGDAAPVAKARPDYLRLLESLHLD